ncbi:MAG: flagellin [Clostridium sp.]|uniref:flagellin n=1 Tax=Clostridium sp. DSM 8431 TaxID=1761781 RepID=UPI0008DF5A2A|nr:flagellin [Clostridium sp. DSM 8431]MCR4944378.1 flagellin [Clostridium sp.]SFU30752.1 flagellin [Clostridium sp. DSM 8431]
MRLCHNMNSLSLYNKYKKNLSVSQSTLNKITSGVKINSAKDNPDKIGQSEAMRIKIKSMQTAQKNMQDGSSMLQVADGALQQVNNMLSRLKELAVSAADDTKTEGDKKIIQEEAKQILSGINDIASNTEFNGIKLIGKETVIDNKKPEYQIATTGAEVGDNMKVPIYNINTGFIEDEDGNRLCDIDLVNNPSQAIGVVSASINIVNEIRSVYGAINNKFDSSYERLQSSTDIAENASSKLTDADIAEEMVNYSKTQILYEAQIALIAQSNRFPMDALKVLDKL